MELVGTNRNQRQILFVSLALLSWFVTRSVSLVWSLNFQMDEIYFAGYGEEIAAGSFPSDDPLYQYPPGAGMLFWVLHVAPGTFHRAFTGTMLISDAVILALLLTNVVFRGGSWRGPVVWIIGGYLAGGLMYERFDVFPTFIVVLALLLHAHPKILGLLAGVAATVKMWPLLILFAVPRRSPIAADSSALAGVLGTMVIANLIAANSLGFISGQFGRGLQIESLGAVPLMLASIAGWAPVTSADQFGASEIVPPATEWVANVSIVVGAVLVAALTWAKLSGRLEVFPSVDVAFVVVLIFVLFNKVYSPQFFIWLCGVGSVALLARASRMTIPVFLVCLSMVPSKDFIGPKYWSLQAIQPITVMFQSMRMAIMLLALVIGIIAIVRFVAGSTRSRSNLRMAIEESAGTQRSHESKTRGVW